VALDKSKYRQRFWNRPVLYLIYATDLTPKSPLNKIIKHADDVALLVVQNSPVSLEDKFSQIQSWYAASKLKKLISVKPNKLAFIV